jgi:hypothetical protein
MSFTEKENGRFITLISISWIKDFFYLISNKPMFSGNKTSVFILVVVGNDYMILRKGNIVIFNG